MSISETSDRNWHSTDPERELEQCEDMQHVGDNELFTQFRSGDTEALGILLQRHAGRMLGYLRKYCGDDAEDAEDIWQDVAVNILQRSQSFKDGAEFLPWLYVVTRNAMKDFYRRKESRSKNIVVRDMERIPGTFSFVSLGRDEVRAQIHTIINELPPEYANTGKLFYYEGLKYREIAERQGISVGTVRSRMHSFHEFMRGRFRQIEITPRDLANNPQ